MQGRSKLKENDLAEVDKMATPNEKVAPNSKIKQHHKIERQLVCTHQAEENKLPPTFVTHSKPNDVCKECRLIPNSFLKIFSIVILKIILFVQTFIEFF
jgi:hypothetical protein